MSAKILSASALLAVRLPRDQPRRPERQPGRVRARRRHRAAVAVSGDRQDLGRPGRRDPGNGAGGPAAEAVAGTRGCACAASRCHALSPHQAKTSAATRRNSRAITPGGTTIRVKYSDGSKDGNREIFSGGRGGEAPVDPRVRLRSDLSDHARLQRLPGRPDVGLGATRQTLVPRNIPTRIDRVVIVEGTTPTRDGAGASSMKPSRICQRARCGRDSARISTRSRSWGCSSSTVIESQSNSDWSAGARSIRARATRSPLKDDDNGAPVFFERPDATACSEPVIAVQDIGATFGGAGS